MMSEGPTLRSVIGIVDDGRNFDLVLKKARKHPLTITSLQIYSFLLRGQLAEEAKIARDAWDWGRKSAYKAFLWENRDVITLATNRRANNIGLPTFNNLWCSVTTTDLAGERVHREISDVHQHTDVNWRDIVNTVVTVGCNGGPFVVRAEVETLDVITRTQDMLDYVIRATSGMMPSALAMRLPKRIG